MEKFEPQLNNGYSAKEIADKWDVPLSLAFKELVKGAKIEREHTNNIGTSYVIASHHLYKESIYYYRELAKMESKLAKGGIIKRSRHSGYKGFADIEKEAKRNIQNAENKAKDEAEMDAWERQLDALVWNFQDELDYDSNLGDSRYIDNEIGFEQTVIVHDQLELKITINPEDSGEIIVNFPEGTPFAGDTMGAADYVETRIKKENLVKVEANDSKITARQLMRLCSQAIDILNIESGSQLYADIELQKKYKKQLDEYDIPFDLSSEVRDILENENYHFLNQYLGLSGRYGEETKAYYIKFASGKDARNSFLNPKIFEVEVHKVKKAEKSTEATFKNQLERIEHIKKLIDEKGDDPMKYSEKELMLLRTYEGMGGQNTKVTEIDLGLTDQFYTPYLIIEKMWGLAFKHGFSFTGEKKVLEPACGIGRFFEYVPESGHNIVGYEIDKYAYTIAKLSFPKFNIYNKPFEQMFWDEKTKIKREITPFFDLVIGNPPYRPLDSEMVKRKDVFNKTEIQHTGAETFDQYMLTRGIDKLVPGGLLIFIIPNTFLSNAEKYNTLKGKIMAKAELIDAYRLPNGVFAATSIGTDIVVFRKKETTNVRLGKGGIIDESLYGNWIESHAKEYIDPKTGLVNITELGEACADEFGVMTEDGASEIETRIFEIASEYFELYK